MDFPNPLQVFLDSAPPRGTTAVQLSASECRKVKGPVSGRIIPECGAPMQVAIDLLSAFAVSSIAHVARDEAARSTPSRGTASRSATIAMIGSVGAQHAAPLP